MITPEEARDMLHYESEDGFTAPELCLTAELAARAPGMAEQIGNMHYEYAVQVNDRQWLRENDEGQFTLTFDPMRALRHCHPRIAAEIAKAASAQFSCDCRVVRRLAADWEVAP